MTYYRYEDPIMYFDSYSKIQLLEYEVLKITPCGVWIKYHKNDNYIYAPTFKFIEGRKFILERSILNKTITKKRFAWPTKKEALDSYKYRKEYQINILFGKLEQAKVYLKIANRIEL